MTRSFLRSSEQRRAWRAEVLDDLGGPDAVHAARRALIETALGAKIVLDSIDRYLFELAAQDGLVNKRNRRAFAIVSDRQRIADGLTRQLLRSGWSGRRCSRRICVPIPRLARGRRRKNTQNPK